MLERPKFVFEQQDERQQGQSLELVKQMRSAIDAKIDHANRVEKPANLETLETASGKGSDKRHPENGRKNDGGLALMKSQSHMPQLSVKLNVKEGLKYKQPESHMVVLPTDPAAKPAEPGNKTGSQIQYEEKMAAHLDEAKGMKPNHFFREDNQSPIPQDDQRYTLAPPVYAPTEFDPYKYVNLSKKRSSNKSYQIMLEKNDSKKKKKTSSIADTTNQSSFQNSSHVAINEPELKPEIQEEPSTKIIREERIDAALLHPPQGSILQYSFQIERIFWKNFINPEFKIKSLEGETLVSAQKESFHINSHYNIFSGDTEKQQKIGTVVGNFGGSVFNIYTEQDEELVATVCYNIEVSCNSFRKLEIYLKSPHTSKCFTEALTKGKDLKDLFEDGLKEDILRVITKEPTWREDLRVYVMNLKGKSKMSSTKNMALTREKESESCLLFCKQGYRRYYLEFGAPFNLLVSMGLMLSSFDFKLLSQ